MNSLKAIIIDDEPDCVRILELQLAKHCPEVQVIGKTEIAEDGLVMLLKTPPDVLFLDIEMPRMNGFDLLEKVGNLNFQVVFTTAYDRYAIRAFKFSALDYLLKPIDPAELKATVERAAQKEHKAARFGSKSASRMTFLYQGVYYSESFFRSIVHTHAS